MSAIPSLVRRLPCTHLPRTCCGLLLVALTGALAPLAGCEQGQPVGQATTAEPTSSAAQITSEGDALGLVIAPVGGLQTVAQQLVIRADAELFPVDMVDELAVDGTKLSFEPAVDGQLRVAGARSLSFAPTTGFRPDTDYHAQLSSLATLARVWTPEDPQAWTADFHTAPLGLLRVSAEGRDRTAQVATVDLVFSAPVQPDQVGSRLKLDAEDMRIRSVRAGPGPGLVRVTLAGKALAAAQVDVSLDLDAGVPWLYDAQLTAPASTGHVTLTDGPPLEILAVMVKEGVSGHYLEVVCRDHAVDSLRYYWDRDTWDGWDVSTRCLLDEDELRGRVHLDGSGVSAGRLSAGKLGEQGLSLSQAAGGFRIFAPFSRGSATLRIDAGARTVDGGVLPLSYEVPLVIPGRQPRLSFRSQGRYLPRDAWRSLPVEHTNVAQATLSVRHIPPQNLAFWLTGDEPADQRTSDLVMQTVVPLAGAEDQPSTTWLDVGSLVPDVQRGVIQLTLNDESSDTHAASRLLLTDMHLIAKRSASLPDDPAATDLWAWAVGVDDNLPLSGVSLELLQPSGRAAARCTTSALGGCRLTVPAGGVDDAAPIAIVARKGDDLTYLAFDEVEDRPEDDVSGVSSGAAAPYRAAVWLDRGVYRPGDVAHVAAVVRTSVFDAPAADLPVVLKVLDARSRELRRQVLQTNAVGAVAMDVAFADFATTGAWRVEAQVADRRVGSASFNVEEFVPERMAVEASVPDAQAGAVGGWLMSQEIPVDVDARWLFGGSAAGSRVELQCSLRAHSFSPEGSGTVGVAGRWSYGLAFAQQDSPPPVDLGRLEASLDDAGHGQFSCPAAAAGAAVLGPAELVAAVAVFEGDSGRATRATANAPVHPAPYYLGLSTSIDDAKEGDSFTLKGKVVGWTGGILPGALSQVRLRLYRVEEELGWVWDEDEDSTFYRRTRRRVLESESTLPVVDGLFAADLVATGGGAGWMVDVQAGDAHTERYVEGKGQQWYWDPWDTTIDQTPRPQRPTWLSVQAPAQADAGQTVAVTTVAPYSGRMLLTVETDTVHYQQWRTVQAGPVEWSVPLEVSDSGAASFVPNVYVTALLLKDPHLESAQAFVPGRALGSASIKIRPTKYSQEVKLSAPAEVRPWGPLSVSLDVGASPADGGPRFATVAVVDEGVLSLTDFRTPDPRDQIFARRALGVHSYETVGWTLLTEPGGASSRTGGDTSGKALGRVQAIQPLALWSGLVAVPASGKLELSFDLPGYRGQLRVMAVVMGTQRLGSASAQVRVADPIVLQTTLPRFLTGSDVAHIPVRLTNTTDHSQSVTVRVELADLDGPTGSKRSAGPPALELVAPPGGPVELAEGQSQTVFFSVAARRAPSAARIVVTATSGKLSSREELSLPVHTAQPLVRQAQVVRLQKGETSLSKALAGWIPGTAHSDIWLSGSPHADLMSSLGWLVRYPYGCIEQTTSSTRPLLFVREQVQHVDPALVATQSVDELVAAGIERVLGMQLPAGSFSYWPGGSWSSTWGSVYATHLLLDAREAGFSVPDRAVDDALSWIELQVAGRLSADSETAYGHYILARAGRGRPALAQRVLDELLARPVVGVKSWNLARQRDQAYLLMAALQASGDHRYEAQLHVFDPGKLSLTRANDNSYWSGLRGLGMRLAVAQELFGADLMQTAAAQAAADKLAEALSQQRPSHYTTQELSWAVTALGRSMGLAPAAAESARLVVGGRALSARQGAWQLGPGDDPAGLELKLSTLDGPTWAVVSTTGVRSDEPVALGSHGLDVQRSFVDAAGGVLDPSSLPLGTPIYVRLDVRNDTDRGQANLALVDRLPAGWELENPRLSGAERPAWTQDLDLWSADYMNLRDDGVEVFGDLPSKTTRSLVFGVRAVTAGSFVLPPVQVEAMYGPDLWSRQAQSSVEVVGPWDDGLL